MQRSINPRHDCHAGVWSNRRHVFHRERSAEYFAFNGDELHHDRGLRAAVRLDVSVSGPATVLCWVEAEYWRHSGPRLR